MPSTVVHCALGGLLAASLLGEEFDARAVAVVLLAAALPDLDVFAGFFVSGGHRSVLHNLFVPLGTAIVLYYDTRLRDQSFVRRRWRSRGVHLAWVSIAAFVIAGIGLDLVSGGVNLFYPIHDQFYELSGKLSISNTHGLVQTFMDFSEHTAARGSTGQYRIGSGIDPTRGAEPKTVERIFPIAQSGWQLLLILTSGFVLAARLWRVR